MRNRKKLFRNNTKKRVINICIALISIFKLCDKNSKVKRSFPQ